MDSSSLLSSRMPRNRAIERFTAVAAEKFLRSKKTLLVVSSCTTKISDLNLLTKLCKNTLCHTVIFLSCFSKKKSGCLSYGPPTGGFQRTALSHTLYSWCGISTNPQISRLECWIEWRSLYQRHFSKSLARFVRVSSALVELVELHAFVQEPLLHIGSAALDSQPKMLRREMEDPFPLQSLEQLDKVTPNGLCFQKPSLFKRTESS